MNLPFVSVIIPCRNEERFIKKCVDSIMLQDYPKDKIEVLVVDGMSTDGTRGLISDLMKVNEGVKMVDNSDKVVPGAMNIGIKSSCGEVIVRMDAHNIYEKDYISKCVKYLYKYNADNVGGICMTVPGGKTVLAEAIAFVLSHFFGVGNAYFRIGTNEPKYVDTVPFGCYRKEVFEKIGLFDEDLIRNQDDEFNLRLIKNGGKILLVPEIISYYVARDSLAKLARMYFQYGYFKPLVAMKIGSVLTLRQLIPVIFVGSLVLSFLSSLIFKPLIWVFLVILLTYLVANVAFSFSVAVKKGLRYLPVLPAVFSTIHISYGIGYLKGILDFIVLKKHKKNRIKDIPLTR
jgi:cellulose synthase/poly-beta-1,6-N-acetylglucosamine synthase-like glycosyltransferase